MKNLQINFYKVLAVFLFFGCGKAKKSCKPGQVNDASQYFYVTARGISRLKKNIMFESNVLDWFECGTSCLDTRFCVGYNFKQSSTNGQVNCQLTHTGDQTFGRISTEDNDWTFYKTEGKRMSECEEENECENGGKIAWDPVKPFKCKCPENYFGELCEKFDICLSSPCFNNGSCVGNESNTGYLCTCRPGYTGSRCEKTYTSCKEVLDNNSSAPNGVYHLNSSDDSGMYPAYCHMSSLSKKCAGGGWTLVMKLDGDKTTFRYKSRFWTNKETWNVDVGLDGLKQIEAKLASYHNTPFTKLCLGMTRKDVTNWILVNYNAFSLYSLVADGNYRKTNAGRRKWKSLVNGASLQEHCNREGFNVKFSHHNLKLRIGIAGNNENDCSSCDSVLGFGFDISQLKGSSGDIHAHGSQIHTFGYIFVQ